MSRHTGALSFIIVSSKKPHFDGVAALALVNARLSLWIVGWVHSRGWERDEVSVRKGRLRVDDPRLFKRSSDANSSFIHNYPETCQTKKT